MTGGFYNHLDDPDEFWDEKPLGVSKSQSVNKIDVSPPNPSASFGAAPPTSTSRSENAASNSLSRAGMFEMTLDDRRLPVHVSVKRNIHSSLDPIHFSAAAMTGYTIALWKKLAPSIVQRDVAAASTLPSRRAKFIALLNAKSAAEFEVIENATWGNCNFIGSGPTTITGQPSVTAEAGLGSVSSIHIDPHWAATARPSDIAHDIVQCADQIRQQRPTFHEEGGSWAHLSDDELENQVREYRQFLTRSH
ncbi:hypothetical protein [Nocardia sp. NPDC051832]|uniref:hypothetical protein n=1 Tax=Nocardia sp. NPDC051832 TaxID=3155673 RepID=UPI003414A980